MLTIYIDGDQGDGTYFVACPCGVKWYGQALRFGVVHYNPALPIAEAAAHHNMEHLANDLRVKWSMRFGAWLRSHWEASSLVVQHAGYGIG